MKIKCFLISLSILFISCISDNNSKHSNTTSCPKRIVSMSLASDEIVLDLINDERIIGVTYLATNQSLSNVFEKAKSVPNIVYPNLEQLISLKPDLIIIASYVDQDFITLIEESGIKLLILNDIQSIDDIKENINLIGKSVCEEHNAETLINEMNRKLKLFETKNNTKHPRVLYMFPTLFTAGADTTVGEIIERSGGINIGKKAGITGNKRISVEYILEENPDIIIVNNYNINEPNFLEKIKSDKVLKNLKAIKNSQIHVVKTKHLTSVSHYVVKGIEDLSEIISKFNAN